MSILRGQTYNPAPHFSRLKPFFVLALSLVFVLSLALKFSNVGFNFADEAYYLTWIGNPTIYSASIHPFGIFYSPIFHALGNSLFLFRLSGLLFLIGSGLWLGVAIEKTLGPFHQRLRGSPLAAALATTSYYSCWIMTPGYNQLATVAACLMISGVLWVVPSTSRTVAIRSECLCIVSLSLGGYIAFMAKPTFAGLAAIVVGVSVLSCGKTLTAVRRVLLAALVSGSMVLINIQFVGGLPAFIGQITSGLKYIKFGNSLPQLPAKTLEDLYRAPPFFWIYLTVAVSLVVAGRISEDVRSAILARRRTLLLVLVPLLVVFISEAAIGLRSGNAPWLMLGMCLMSTSLALFGFLSLEPSFLIRSPVSLLIVTLAVLPILLSFGSAISLTAQCGMYMWAPLLAIWIELRLIIGRESLADLALGLMISFVLVWSTMSPFGGTGPLYKQRSPIEIPGTRSVVLVDQGTAQLAIGLRRVAVEGGLSASTPVIDLTGFGPGAVMMLGGRAPYFPWQFASFGDPIPLLNETWRSLSDCEKSRTWLIGPFAPAFRNAEVVRDFASHRFNYRAVATSPLRLPTRVGITGEISLWKPEGAAC